MENAAEVAIIGGGVIGLTTAYFLAREGRRTTVFDKGDLGQEASWAGAGILPACDLARARTPLERLRGHSCALFPTLSSELLQFTRIDNGYRQCGGLEFLDVPGRIDDDEWNADPGAAGPLSGRQLSELEPSVASNLGRAVHLPGMAQVRNPWHLRALIAACEKLAVNLRRHCPTTALERAGNRISAVRTPQGHVEVGSVLVAAGAWSEDLLAIVGWKPGIKPIRGQIVLLKAPAVPLQHILLWGSRYIVPRGDGHILVGSTEEDAGFEKRNTAVAVQELLELACRLVPDLAGATIERCWSGLRPGSPDGSPFLGRVPGLANLFVAAGHFRAGIVLSPGTALVMKELLLGQKTTVPLDAFRLDRPQKC